MKKHSNKQVKKEMMRACAALISSIGHFETARCKADEPLKTVLDDLVVNLNYIFHCLVEDIISK